MKKGCFFALIPGVLIVVVGVFVLTLFLVKIMWSWTIPDLFPGAVEEGLIAEHISWLTAIKVALFIAFISGICSHGKGK